MDVERLRSFREVARRGGISQASRGLPLTTSAISRHVAALETELGRRLFTRQGSRMVLTFEGERLLDYSERILGLIDEATLVLSGRPSGGRRLVHVGSSSSVGSYLVPHCLTGFTARRPEIEIVHRIYERPTVETLVANGTLDLGIIPGPAHHAEVRARRIAEDELILVAAPEHPLAAAATLPEEGLAGELVFAEELKSLYRESVLRHLARARIAPPRFCQMPSIEASKRAVAAGHGLAYLPTAAVDAELRLGILVELPLPKLRIRRSIIALTRDPFPTSGPLADLVDHLARSLNH